MPADARTRRCLENRRPEQRAQGGFSIIEIMVGVTLGLLLTGIVVSIFIATGRHYAQDERVGRMQENARFALRVLADDLSLADFWGPVLAPQNINAALRSCADTPEAISCAGFFAASSLSLDTASDCGPGTAATPPPNWLFDITRPVEVLLDATADAAASAFACIDVGEFQDGTDVLAIKRVRALELASDRSEPNDSGEVYLRTNGDVAMLHVYNAGDTTTVQGPGVSDWQYLVHVYYIRKDSLVGSTDGVPTLYRRVLNGTGMQIEDGGVARGVEALRVLFGIDTDADGIPNSYVSGPSEAQLAAAVTARVYLLVRAAEPDQAYLNNKTYRLGDLTVTGDGDKYYRRVFTTTVKLRNPSNRSLLNL